MRLYRSDNIECAIGERQSSDRALFYLHPRLRFDTDAVVHGSANPPLAAEIAFSGLHGNVTEKELDLIQLSIRLAPTVSAHASRLHRGWPRSLASLAAGLAVIPRLGSEPLQFLVCRPPGGNQETDSAPVFDNASAVGVGAPV